VRLAANMAAQPGICRKYRHKHMICADLRLTAVRICDTVSVSKTQAVLLELVQLLSSRSRSHGLHWGNISFDNQSRQSIDYSISVPRLLSQVLTPVLHLDQDRCDNCTAKALRVNPHIPEIPATASTRFHSPNVPPHSCSCNQQHTRFPNTQIGYLR
jgi:hypothetical protein